MEYEYSGVTFRIERDVPGLTIVIKEISSTGLPDFGQEDMQSS